MLKHLQAFAITLTLALTATLTGCGAGTFGTLTPPGKPPIAAISSVLSGGVGVPIEFSALGSSDPQGEPLTFFWNFGDGTGLPTPIVDHPYAAAGTYTVTLTVTDFEGLTATATAQCKVGVAPTANAGGPYTGTVGGTVTLNGAGSFDPQGQALTYYWSFGDGSTGSGVSPVHAYAGAGTYRPSLIVTNSSGIASTPSYSSVVIVLPPPVAAINGPYTGRPTLAIQFVGHATSPYDADFQYTWNFGDGTTSSVVAPQHTYAAPGTYNVTLQAVGQYAESANAATTATITTQTTGPAFSGTVLSGATPVVGAHVHLFAASTAGYNQASIPVLTGTALTDTLGPYVLTAAGGAFTIPAGFPCPTHEQVYLYATGGATASTPNSAIGLLSAPGACGYFGTSSAPASFVVNEATTVAAAYAMAGYATSPSAVSSPNTTQAQTGIGNAFFNAANLASNGTGAAVLTTLSTNGAAPQSTVNTLADILNACTSASSATASACTNLFANSQSNGTTPTDTAAAALNIAHSQGANAAALYALLPAGSPFQPTLTAAPHDWALGISYGGLGGYGTEGLAADTAGNIWVLQYPRAYGNAPYLTELTSNGAEQVAEDSTCNAGNVGTPYAITIDSANNVWILANSGFTAQDPYGNAYSYYTAQYCTVSPAGLPLSPPGGFYLGGNMNSSLTLYNLANDAKGNGYLASFTLLERSLTGAALNGTGYIAGNSPYIASVAIDGTGNFWLTSPSTNGIVKLSPTGATISPANGYTGGGLTSPGPIALDSAGNAWAISTQTNYLNAGTSVSKFSSTGAPLSGNGFTNGLTTPYALAIDGAGNAWVADGYALNSLPTSVVELTPTGAPGLSIAHDAEAREYLDGPQSIAVDSAGSVWLSNGLAFTVTQFVGASIPVVTPLAANLAAPYNAPASKP